jgi:hypothetical protein
MMQYMNKLICHMTSLHNLATIVKNSELLCKNELIHKGFVFDDIANPDVQDKRAKVSINSSDTLHDYVPFYFWGTTPMLLVNKTRQETIIFLVSDTDTIAKTGIDFMFTDRHAVIKYANFYSNLDDLNKLNWQIITKKYWGDSDDNREKKQAEFLIYKKLSFNQIYGIGVANDDAKDNVLSILKNSQHQPTVKIKKEWYFT